MKSEANIFVIRILENLLMMVRPGGNSSHVGVQCDIRHNVGKQNLRIGDLRAMASRLIFAISPRQAKLNSRNLHVQDANMHMCTNVFGTKV